MLSGQELLSPSSSSGCSLCVVIVRREFIVNAVVVVDDAVHQYIMMTVMIAVHRCTAVVVKRRFVGSVCD